MPELGIRWPDGWSIMIVLLALLVVPALGFAQISPGPLSRAHAKLDGQTQCFTCHGARKDPMRARCLDCHEGIARLVAAGRGFHARLSGKDCAACHPEHAGVDFDLIAWEESGFEGFAHQRTGFELEGRHGKLLCRACHKPSFQTDPIVALLESTDASRRWTGLETTCAGCHDDRHNGALGSDCQQCHGSEDWKSVPSFDHAETRFPLEGAHASKARCDDCHRAERLHPPQDASGQVRPVFRPVPHAECSDCHEDPHAGRLGLSCSSCHVVDSFRTVRGERFDHEMTRYPLRGGHVGVKCASCHGSSEHPVRRPAFARCGDCHADPHAQESAWRAKGRDCASCHRVEGWLPSTYSLARHRETGYPLDGRHAELACAACHRPFKGRPARSRNAASARGLRAVAATPKGAWPAGISVRLRLPSERCQDCHLAAHGDQFAGRPDGGACASCHTTAGFRPSSFTSGEHGRLSLRIEGAHAAAGCVACHGPQRPGLPAPKHPERLGPAGVVLALGALACTSCHVDPHQGRFAANPSRPERMRCKSCHGVVSFRPSTITARAHAEFGFGLDGAHLAIPCSACHAELTRDPSASTLLLDATAVAPMTFGEGRALCAQCHEDIHGGQFASRPGGESCASCHDVEAFVPAAKFNHDKDTAFALSGAHLRVACSACHKKERGRNGKQRVIYRGTPVACEECHRAATTGGDS